MENDKKKKKPVAWGTEDENASIYIEKSIPEDEDE